MSVEAIFANFGQDFFGRHQLELFLADIALDFWSTSVTRAIFGRHCLRFLVDISYDFYFVDID